MSITLRVLGDPGRDNALLLRVDSGDSINLLLFDCGDGCLSGLRLSEIQSIDHLFLSHLHMDHIGGFDSFFRCVFNRDSRENRIWGPPDTAGIMQHRFRGFMWNLHQGQPGTWRVTDIHDDSLHTYRFELSQAFSQCHDEGARDRREIILSDTNFTVSALIMDHMIPSMAYIVKEKPRRNIDTRKLKELGLDTGPWLKKLKDEQEEDSRIEIDGKTYDMLRLREELLVETPGDSVAYLTDFMLDDKAPSRLAPALAGCKTVICEAQYRHDDLEIAERNYHMTTVQAAGLAREAAIDELILFHLSDRYKSSEWLEMLDEARSIFENTRFSDHWEIG